MRLFGHIFVASWLSTLATACGLVCPLAWVLIPVVVGLTVLSYID